MTNSLRDIGGDVLYPGDERYDATRMVWNAAIDRHPRVIVRAGSVRDVVTAVRVARDRDLEIGVRCGGHSAAGHAVPDGGLMIDLSRLGQVRVDPAARRAWVSGGALLGALDRAAQRHGLATTAGNVSHTGVGGLTLGGGMGWLARRFGLACDNVLAYQLVTADGRILRVTAEQHPDLFWALRGGGGNFGVVTEFEFALHHIGTQALIVEVDFPIERAASVLRAWRDLAADAPAGGDVHRGYRRRDADRGLRVGWPAGRGARIGAGVRGPWPTDRHPDRRHLLSRAPIARRHRRPTQLPPLRNRALPAGF